MYSLVNSWNLSPLPLPVPSLQTVCLSSSSLLDYDFFYSIKLLRILFFLNSGWLTNCIGWTFSFIQRLGPVTRLHLPSCPFFPVCLSLLSLLLSLPWWNSKAIMISFSDMTWPDWTVTEVNRWSSSFLSPMDWFFHLQLLSLPNSFPPA